MNQLQVKPSYPELALPLDDKELTEMLLELYFEIMWQSDMWETDYNYSPDTTFPSHQDFLVDEELDDILDEITAQEIYGTSMRFVHFDEDEIYIDEWHANKMIYIEALIEDIGKVVQHYHLVFEDHYSPAGASMKNMPVMEVW